MPDPVQAVGRLGEEVRAADLPPVAPLGLDLFRVPEGRLGVASSDLRSCAASGHTPPSSDRRSRRRSATPRPGRPPCRRSGRARRAPASGSRECWAAVPPPGRDSRPPPAGSHPEQAAVLGPTVVRRELRGRLSAGAARRTPSFAPALPLREDPPRRSLGFERIAAVENVDEKLRVDRAPQLGRGAPTAPTASARERNRDRGCSSTAAPQTRAAWRSARGKRSSVSVGIRSITASSSSTSRESIARRSDSASSRAACPPLRSRAASAAPCPGVRGVRNAPPPRAAPPGRDPRTGRAGPARGPGHQDPCRA